MGKTYTLEDNDGLMAELKSMRGKMAEMRGRLERDEITPDDWRQWYAGYKARLDEIREAISGCARRFLAEMQIWNIKCVREQQNSTCLTKNIKSILSH